MFAREREFILIRDTRDVEKASFTRKGAGGEGGGGERNENILYHERANYSRVTCRVSEREDRAPLFRNGFTSSLSSFYARNPVQRGLPRIRS